MTKRLKPKLYDTQDIITSALLADTTGSVWRDIIADARKHDPGSFVTGEDEWCYRCDSYCCSCWEDELRKQDDDEDIWRMSPTPRDQFAGSFLYKIIQFQSNPVPTVSTKLVFI